MSDVYTAIWSETPASNNAATPNGWPEGMNPSAVNDTAREDHAAVKRLYDRDHATTAATVGGTATAITLTYPVAYTAYAQGQKFAFKATAASTGATTVNVDTLGALNVFRRSLTGAAVALVGGEWQAGDIVELEHDGTQFQLLNLSPTRAVVLFGSGIALTAGTTSYIGPWGSSSTESNVQVPAPFAGRIRNLQVFAPVAPGVGQSFTATLMVGGVAQALTAAVSGATNSAGDTTHAVSVAAGAALDVRLVASAGAASSFIGVSFEIATP